MLFRSGDKGSLTSKRCACGSILARLQNLGGRMESSVNLPGAGILTIADLDEILLKIPEITAYEAWIEQGEQDLFAPKKTEVLRIDLYTLENSASKVKDNAFKAVQTNPDIKQALTTSSLQIRFDFCKENPNKSHTIKRKLIDKR